MKRTKPPELPQIADEPGMAERFQRGLRNLLNTPAKPHGKNPTTPRAPKLKERSASKGRANRNP